MDRKKFLGLSALGMTGLTGIAGGLSALSKLNQQLGEQDYTLPVLFVGHGSPMNAIEDNTFSRSWREMGKKLPRPKAILCISAHWETKGTFVTASPHPETIHDFYGFPKPLFDVQYPAPGDPLMAELIQKESEAVKIGLDHEWGFDHGCWSIIMHMFPEAEIPVLQLSLDYSQAPAYHYALARELKQLRKKGVLILGSGNIVHNLRMIDFHNTKGFDWAIAANEEIKQLISKGNDKALTQYSSLSREAQMGIPTPEHYLPLLYVLGMRDEKENPQFFNDQTVAGSIAMTSVRFG